MNAKVVLLPLLWVMGLGVYAQQTLPKRKLADTLYLVSGLEAAKQSAEIKALQARQIQAVQTNGLLISALNQKAKVPDFTLKNTQGKSVNLFALLQGGPVILLWYQGGWNKYCALTLRYFQAYQNEFKKYGACILAITPELPEKTLATQTKNKLTFDLLSDKDNAVARQFGIVYTLNDTLKKEYETLYALSKTNGNTKGELPLPVTYVVNPNGKIAFAFLNADYRQRVEPGDLLRVLKGMGFPERKTVVK